jgi:ACR3 family arsenite transporter
MHQSKSALGVFERYLSVWVALCIVTGVLLGSALPQQFAAISALEVASVNLPVAILIWVMIYPMMVNVDFASLHCVKDNPRGILITLVVNWLIKPFSMALLAVLFFEYIFAGLINPDDAKQYIAGLILLGVAPCTAMVFVWSQLVKGDANYTLVQVSLNDIIMIVAFAPLTALLLGVSDIIVPWNTLLLSVVLYVLIPLLAGYFTRINLDRNGNHREIERFTARLKPFSIIGLLATVVLLFAFQAETLLSKPLIIGLIAVPLLIQGYGIFIIAYVASYLLKVPHRIAAPASLIGTSNFFELAVAVAIGLFGLHSGAALATVVGVLVEVPVMLSLVAIANRTRHSFP